VVTSVVEVRSRRGAAVQLYSILLPVTSCWMKHHLDARRLAGPRMLVDQGIAVARSLGCRCVALGQYTSIVTRNGKLLTADGIRVTTGNSYALALALQALERAHRERGSEPAASVLAVVGAAGNIGRTCAAMLAPGYRRTMLVGSNRPGSHARLAALAQRLPNATVATDPDALAAADVVVAALNAVDAPLGTDHFAPGAVVCDLSVPAGTCPDLGALRPDLLLIRGGTVRLPLAEDLEIPGFPLPPGYTYGCMAEAVLLGFEGACGTSFTGPVRPRQVRHIAALARRHGFELADYKRLCVLDSRMAEVVPV
jgi:predicted amino acid dehydrogenase